MKQKRIVQILKALWLWQLMDRGEGLRLSEVSQWSGISRATTYRYLKKLVKLNTVAESFSDYRGKPTTHYKITRSGLWMLDEIPAGGLG